MGYQKMVLPRVARPSRGTLASFRFVHPVSSRFIPSTSRGCRHFRDVNKIPVAWHRGSIPFLTIERTAAAASPDRRTFLAPIGQLLSTRLLSVARVTKAPREELSARAEAPEVRTIERAESISTSTRGMLLGMIGIRRAHLSTPLRPRTPGRSIDLWVRPRELRHGSSSTNQRRPAQTRDSIYASFALIPVPRSPNRSQITRALFA